MTTVVTNNSNCVAPIAIWFIFLTVSYFFAFFFSDSAVSRFKTLSPIWGWDRSTHWLSYSSLFSFAWCQRQPLQPRGKNSIGPLSRYPDCCFDSAICKKCTEVGKFIFTLCSPTTSALLSYRVGGSQWGGGFYGYRLKFWLFYGYRLIFFSYG